MFNLSISPTSALPIDHASEYNLIFFDKNKRRLAVNFFESQRLSIGLFGSKITAAATTGPASGPLPTSSTPATKSALFISNSLRDSIIFN